MAKNRTVDNPKVITIYLDADDWDRFQHKYKSASAKIREWIKEDLNESGNRDSTPKMD